MSVFIDFWKLKTKNNFLHVFSFLHKLSFKNNFYFLFILGCQTIFLISNIENCFWKHKIRRKNNYQTYPKCFTLLVSQKNKKKMLQIILHTILFFSFFFLFFFVLWWTPKQMNEIFNVGACQRKMLKLLQTLP